MNNFPNKTGTHWDLMIVEVAIVAIKCRQIHPNAQSKKTENDLTRCRALLPKSLKNIYQSKYGHPIDYFDYMFFNRNLNKVISDEQKLFVDEHWPESLPIMHQRIQNLNKILKSNTHIARPGDKS